MKCKGSTDIERAVSPDSRVEMKMVHVDGESLGTGIATAVVDSSVEECAANKIFALYSTESKRI